VKVRNEDNKELDALQVVKEAHHAPSHGDAAHEGTGSHH
jgi:hypothetical protein